MFLDFGKLLSVRNGGEPYLDFTNVLLHCLSLIIV